MKPFIVTDSNNDRFVILAQVGMEFIMANMATHQLTIIHSKNLAQSYNFKDMWRYSPKKEW